MFHLWFGILVVALVAAEVQVPDDIAGVYGELRDDKPEPCCAPSYSTFKSTHFLTYSLGEGVSVEMQRASTAYDSVSKRTASKTHLGFFNGTEEYYHTIDDYAAGVSYSIARFSGELTCRVNELKKRFQEDCIPEDATYVGSHSLGDRAVEVDSWYMLEKQPGQDVHRVSTLQTDECVLLYSTARYVSPDTGVTFTTENNHITDFKLGICESEEEEFFHVPDICHERAANDDSKIPAELLKKITRLSPTLTRGL
ncbi:uncharacterized protein LOC119736911 [Patiria miniata]|uniref:Uncharacterized protein n=1 Tax=Patiria miniata TaxID=46514 RepID=A0A914AS33_PATMI|nr:uncharacterized protein LOC119736911 [Patiria miniata]